MEKKLYDLEINPELDSLFPALDEKELAMLEKSILEEGCTDPVVVWNNVVIDGHNRVRICRKHNIPFAIEERSFADLAEAMAWMISRQLGRRNLTNFMKAKLALRYEERFRKEAEENRMAGVKLDTDKNANERRTDSRLGELVGLSRDTIAKCRKIEAEADDETKEKLDAGEISVNKAYKSLESEETDSENETAGKPGTDLHNPSSFEPVYFEIKLATDNFVLSIRNALKRYTKSMATHEHNEEIEELIDDTVEEALEIIEKHLGSENIDPVYEAGRVCKTYIGRMRDLMRYISRRELSGEEGESLLNSVSDVIRTISEDLFYHIGTSLDMCDDDDEVPFDYITEMMNDACMMYSNNISTALYSFNSTHTDPENISTLMQILTKAHQNNLKRVCKDVYAAGRADNDAYSEHDALKDLLFACTGAQKEKVDAAVDMLMGKE